MACNNIPTETTTSPVLGPPQIRYPKGLYVGLHGKADTTYGDYYNDAMTELGSDTISGINVGANWSEIQPEGPEATKSDWTKFQAVFDAVGDWNTGNPYNLKTVKLGVHAGFATPTWALNQIVAELGYCDDVPGLCPEGECSVGMFIPTEPGFGNVARALPLPWDPLYQKLWATFVGQFAAQWNGNPALAAVWIDGPTAVSSEMIEPTGDSYSTVGAYEFSVNVAEWQQALAADCQSNSTESFVQPWETAIDLYGASFTNTTLLLITGATFTDSGLPLLGSPIPMGAGLYAPDPNGYCTNPSNPTPNNDCAAETQILSYFIGPTVGGNNDKATEMQGMYYQCDTNVSLGVHGVKLLSLQTEDTTYPVLGGVAYISPISDPCGTSEGCGTPGSCSPACTLTTAEAFTAVMEQAFKNTAAAPIYGATQDYIAPLNFIDVFPQDLDWIATHPAMGTAFEQAASALRETTEIPYEPPPYMPPPSCRNNPMACM